MTKFNGGIAAFLEQHGEEVKPTKDSFFSGLLDGWRPSEAHLFHDGDWHCYRLAGGEYVEVPWPYGDNRPGNEEGS